MTAQLPLMLLVESQFVLRRTIVSVTRDLAKVEFIEATSVDRARAVLGGVTCKGVVLDMQEGARALELISDIRLGKFATARDAQVIALASSLSAEDALRLQELGVTQVLGKPFKIGNFLAAIGC